MWPKQYINKSIFQHFQTQTGDNVKLKYPYEASRSTYEDSASQ